MKNLTQLSDFTFQPRGYGHYNVTYTSPKTGKQWESIISDMTIIDAVKNSDNPKQKDLNWLKFICKSN